VGSAGTDAQWNSALLLPSAADSRLLRPSSAVAHSAPLRTPLPQSHVKIPEDAWEYQIRKSLNDAAYNGLDFVPYSSTMPVQPRDDNPKWIWKKKAAK
jgi:hypothetical protein